MATTRAMTVQETVDQVGFGRFQRRQLGVCGVTWAAGGAELLLLGFALSSIIGEFGLTPTQGGLTVAATFAGMLIGAWFWGTISDYVCRRTGFQVTVLIFAVFGLLSAFAPGWEWLLALHFITGFGLGGALYAWTPESYPTEIRTTGMRWASGMARVAGIVTPTLGGILFGVALVVALSARATAFAIGGLVVFALGVETKRRAISDTVSEPEEG